MGSSPFYRSMFEGLTGSLDDEIRSIPYDRPRQGSRGYGREGCVVYCFKAFRVEVRHHHSIVFQAERSICQLHRETHNRSLVFQTPWYTLFSELASFGLGYMKTLSSQARLKNPCFLDNYKNPCKSVFLTTLTYRSYRVTLLPV